MELCGAILHPGNPVCLQRDSGALLSPDDYGIIAMPLVFLSIAQCFIDSGFSGALIRKPDLTEDDLSTAFYFNIGVGTVCYLALFLASPLIADFYHTPVLADLLKVTALATLFNPLCAVQRGHPHTQDRLQDARPSCHFPGR